MVQIRKDKARVGALGMERRGEGQRDSGAGHDLIRAVEGRGRALGWTVGSSRDSLMLGLQKGEELVG